MHKKANKKDFINQHTPFGYRVSYPIFGGLKNPKTD
jgi:hypothetical protein